MELFSKPIPLNPPSLIKGRGSVGKRGGEAPSLKSSSPSPLKERGIQGVKLVNNLLMIDRI